MPKKAVILAKLSRPRLHDTYLRERLFVLLERRAGYPVIWITGPPGAGKTTLAASYLDAREGAALWYQLDTGDGDAASFFYYLRQAVFGLAAMRRAPLSLLTPEYLADLPGFARRWWRTLFGRLDERLVLVLDNYQEVPADSALHGILVAAADEIPAGAQLIVLSRAEPPPEFSRLLASDRIATLDWNDLRLTFDEARGIAAAREPLAEDALRVLYERCDGWAAGFALMRERLRRTGEINRLGEVLPRETVFDYFATQFFSEAPPLTRETLVRTAFLPRFTTSMAEQLSGNPQAGQLLAHWHENHLFIECRAGAEVTYQYHALFRSFLLAQARTYYTPLGIAQFQELAAGLLEKASQVDEAVGAYLAAQAHDAAMRVIMQHAESLLANGRAQTLQEWIDQLPQAVAERSPWVSYWSAACVLPTRPAIARGIFGGAAARFAECGDILGEIKAAVGVIDSYYLERAYFTALDPWIDLIFERIAQHPIFASATDELSAVSSTMIATLYRQPTHPRLPLLADRTQALLEGEVGVNQRLAAGAFLLNYYDWTGETVRANALVAQLHPLLSHPEATPLRRATWELRLSIHHLALGDFDTTLGNLTEAGTIAREHGFAAIEMTALLFETMLCLSMIDIPGAEAALGQLDGRVTASRRMDYSLALKFKGWVALAKGDLDAAVQFGEQAGDVGEAAGAPNMHSHTLIYLAHFYSERHEYGRAHTALEGAYAATDLEHYPVFHFDAQLIGADLLLREGDPDGSAAALRSALALGARRGYLGSLFWLPRMMERLCAFALERDIETDYVKRLIARRGLQPPVPEVAHWPWPLRVFTLGNFVLERDGVPVRFDGKVPKKPLEMLKVLIAYGGQAVAAETLCAALWPDAEADAADNALGITLKRLRKLLGDERAVSQQGGKLSLDVRRCWVDTWALKALLERADARLRSRESFPDLESVARRICEINGGSFLAGEPEQPWMLPLRDRLRARITRVLLALGQRLEQADQVETAIALYRQALEQDNLSEDLYRRLITCLAKLGQRAEAMAVYRRCRELLSIVLGIQPSEETEQVFRRLQFD
jgi:DNA-binding SARP family transcriptional activator